MKNNNSKKSTWTKTHNIKSKRTFGDNQASWLLHGVVLTNEQGYQRILLNSLPVSNGDALELYMFPAEKKA